MDYKMEASPSCYDPEDLTTRERYRRYGKRLSTLPYWDNTATKSGKTRILTDGHSDYIPSWGQSTSRRSNFTDPNGLRQMDTGDGYMGKGEAYSKQCKLEDGVLPDDGESMFDEFT